jgi:hypothetical protein
MLTEILYHLTSRITQNNGVARKQLEQELRDASNLEANSVKELLRWLHVYGFIDNDGDRITVRPRQLIRTTNDELVFTGATGPSLREQLTAIVDGGLSELELGDGMNLDRFSVPQASFEEDNNTLNELVGHPPSTITAHRLMSDVQSQREWFDGLHWALLAHTNPYANHQGVETKQFSLSHQTMRRAGGQRCDVEFIQSGEGVYRTWRLVRRAHDDRWEAANLLSLDDRRRAKLYVNEINGIFPFHWENTNLHLPKYLFLPTDIERALHVASMMAVDYHHLSISGDRPIESRILRGIDDDLLRLFSRAVFVGEDA